jgi:DNA polymerase III subunit delta
MPAAKKEKPTASASANLRVVVGSDEAEVKRVASLLATEMTPAGAGEFDREIIDGAVQYVDNAVEAIHATIQALLTYPFFGGKLVWLKSATFLADDQLGRSETVIDALEKLTATLEAGLPDSTRFLLSAVGVDKRRTFYKGLSKLAKVEVFDKVDSSKSGWEEEASALAEVEARKRGLQLSGEALELFTLSTGGDRRTVENELDKIDLYLGSARRTVSVDEVRKLVSLSREGVIFELGNALAARDLNHALALLDQLLFQGESAIGIFIVAVMPTIRNLLVVKDLMTRHKLQRPAQPFFFGKTLERLPPAAVAHLPRKKDGTVNAYTLGVAALHAHRFQAAELEAGLHACLEANVRLVTSSLEPKVVLSQLLVRLIAGGK